MKSIRVAGCVVSALLGCAPAVTVVAPLPPVSMSAEAAEAARSALLAQEPTSFKMLHQVVAKYQEQSYLMTGYLLGRKDGSFRVSASAALGLKLFDVARVGGRWESHIYLKLVADRLDPTNLGRSVQRIYFLSASGPLKADAGRWVASSSLQGDDAVDTVEDWRDDKTLALRRRRYLKDGRQVVQVDFDALELVQGSWLARTVHLSDSLGFSLELRVTGYEPGFPVTEESLRVERN
jgi:hypothetical protein